MIKYTTIKPGHSIFSGTKNELCIKKIIAKIPMEKYAIDVDGNLYEYDFINGKIIYTKIGNVKFEE